MLLIKPQACIITPKNTLYQALRRQALSFCSSSSAGEQSPLLVERLKGQDEVSYGFLGVSWAVVRDCQAGYEPTWGKELFQQGLGNTAFPRGFLCVRQFNQALDKLRFDSGVRAVVICSSTPGMFCAGADLKERATMREEEVGPFVHGLRSLMTAVESLPMPTVAVIEGAALGGGLELAMGCDIRIAGAKAILGLTETSLAIIPGAGGTQRLPRIIGEAKAKELIFRAKRLTADEALAVGLVNHSIPEGQSAMDKALEICRDIAANGPIAVRLAKTAVHQGMQVDLATGLEIERACYAQVIPTQDRLEGLKAFKEKRKPKYQGK